MKKIIRVSMLSLLFFLGGCTNYKDTIELKRENAELKTKLEVYEPKTGTNVEDVNFSQKPNVVRATISWLWWALSRQTSIVWDKSYYHSDWITETLPINWESSLDWEVGFRFNGWGYALIASCWEGYIMKSCEPFSQTDSVDNQDTQCFLWNEDPNLMRTSMIIECIKI